MTCWEPARATRPDIRPEAPSASWRVKGDGKAVPQGAPEASGSGTVVADPTRRAVIAGAPAVPTAPAAAVAFLRGAEHAAASAMLDRLRGASASLAQLFASISASEATHVPALDDAVRDATGSAGS